jgi:hypothetical protein
VCGPSGSMSLASEVHEWIGIQYTVAEDGLRAIMRLPPKYLEELVLLLDPFCRMQGSLTILR